MKKKWHQLKTNPLKPSEKPAGKPEEKVAVGIVDPSIYPPADECVTTRYLWIRGVGEIKK